MDEIGAIWNSVTPYAGVWIEISVMQAYNINKSASLPTRECGLKYYVSPLNRSEVRR